MSQRNERMRFNLFFNVKEVRFCRHMNAGGSGKLNTSINILLVRVLRMYLYG